MPNFFEELKAAQQTQQQAEIFRLTDITRQIDTERSQRRQQDDVTRREKKTTKRTTR